MLNHDLTADQREALYTALLSAFRGRGEIERLVTIRMGIKPVPFALSDDLQDTVFNLIKWVESEGPTRLDQLIRKASAEHPDNPSLRQVAVDLGVTWPRTTVGGHGVEQGINGAWNLPPRIENFTGRTEILEELHQRLQGTDGAVGLSQAIAGLGGVGKTSLAREYVERHGKAYGVVLWFNASNTETLYADYSKLACDAVLDCRDEEKADLLSDGVRAFLDGNNLCPGPKPALLVYDNVDDPRQVAGWLPRPAGITLRVLVTSRSNDLREIGIRQPLRLDTMEAGEALVFLQRETGNPFTDKEELAAAQELAQELQYLPLALAQAVAYIADPNVGTSFHQYLLAYRSRRLELLERGKSSINQYAASVATTWDINFALVRELPVAQVLQTCAFLAPDNIPLELFLTDPDGFDEPLRSALVEVQKEFMETQGGLTRWRELLAPAARYALLRFVEDTPLPDTSSSGMGATKVGEATNFVHLFTLHIHRMVQEAILDDMGGNLQAAASTVFTALCEASPGPSYMYGPWAWRFLTHLATTIEFARRNKIYTIPAARLLNDLGFYLRHRGEYQEAELLYKEALVIYRASLPEGHLDIANSLNNLANIYQDQGRYQEAESLYDEALAIFRSTLPEGHLNFANSLNNLASLYYDRGHYQEAQLLFDEALSIRRASLPEGHPDIAQSLNNLAGLYQVQSRYDEAELFLKEALTILRSALPEGHPDIATNLNNLALLYRKRGKYQEGEIFYEEALTIRRASLPEGHPDIAMSLGNLASLYQAQGRYGEAEPLLDEALSIRRVSLPEGHPDIANTFNNLAGLYRAQGRYGEADYLFEKALTILRLALPEGHPHIQLVERNLIKLRQEKKLIEVQQAGQLEDTDLPDLLTLPPDERAQVSRWFFENLNQSALETPEE